MTGFDPAAWVASYEAIGGKLAVHQVDGALFLESTQPRKTIGYELDEELTATPAKLAAVCERLAQMQQPIVSATAPFRAADWLRAFRGAEGKAVAYVYAGDAEDPADPFPVLTLTHPPRGPAAALAEALTQDQRDMAAEHLSQTVGAVTALGSRG